MKQYSILNFKFSIIFFFLFLCSPASSEIHEATEYEVKAAFIYNFAKFVEWPEGSPDNVLQVCILGEDPFGKAIDSIESKSIGKRKVALNRINSVKNSGSCHILFIASSEKRQLRSITQTLSSAKILTIGDSEGFAKKGLVINLFMDKGRVRFEINLDAARRSGLRISPRLLELARIVREDS